MELETSNNAELAHAFRAALGRPPVATGCRLRSERELAESLKVGRKRVRAVLDELVAEGILVRRQGSGTYVRRIPERSVDDLIGDGGTNIKKWFLAGDLLIADDESRQSEEQRLQPSAQQRRLRLEIWSGFHRTTSTNRLILDAMLDRAEHLGHELSVHSIIRSADQPLQEDELAKRLQAQPGDGYLVSASLGSLFKRAYRKAFDATQPSAVYVAPGSSVVDCEPMIRIDTDEAIFRAVRLLRAEGYERVGMICVDNPARVAPTESANYGLAAESTGQTYRAVAEEPRTVEGGYRGMKRLLERAVRPDAVYVSNDEQLPGAVAAIAEQGLHLGVDIGLITLSTTKSALPADVRWSQLQFDPVAVGRDAIDALVNLLQTAGRRLGSQSHMASWIPGETHRR